METTLELMPLGYRAVEPGEIGERSVFPSTVGTGLTMQRTDPDGTVYDLVSLPDGSPSWAPLPPKTAEEVEVEKQWLAHQDRRERNSRPHCPKCGHFVPRKTMRVIRHWEYPEYSYYGVCAVHGKQEVSFQD